MLRDESTHLGRLKEGICFPSIAIKLKVLLGENARKLRHVIECSRYTVLVVPDKKHSARSGFGSLVEFLLQPVKRLDSCPNVTDENRIAAEVAVRIKVRILSCSHRQLANAT